MGWIVRCIFLELKKIFSVIRKNRLLFLLGILGLGLLLFTGTPAKQTEAVSPLSACESYRAALEDKIADTCRTVKGVGEVKVLLTLATTEIAVYEKNQSADSETVAKSGSDAILLAYRMPEIAGISVVCHGGDDPTVKQELTSLLSKALDLNSTQIHIAPFK